MISRYLKLNTENSYILLGPRQTGKTKLIKELGWSNLWTVNLLLSKDYLRYSKDPGLFGKEALFQITKKKIQTIVIDEVQKIPLLLDEVQQLMEETSCHFILTGSSARKLKRGQANLLGGRALFKHLYPFIYSEIKKELQAITLDELLQFGSLPGIFFKNRTAKAESLRAYVNTYLREEIQMEGFVRNLTSFTRFLEVAAQSITESLNYTNIARDCDLPPKTVQNYFDILEDTLISSRLPCWSESIRKQMATHPKFYFFDNGITCALLSRLIDPLDATMRGKLFEQWIINEIKARTEYDQRDIKLFVWRTQAGDEIDVLAARGKKILFVAEIKAFGNLHNNHFKSLEVFHSEHPDVPLYVIVAAESSYNHKNIQIRSYDEFLSQELPKF